MHNVSENLAESEATSFFWQHFWETFKRGGGYNKVYNTSIEYYSWNKRFQKNRLPLNCDKTEVLWCASGRRQHQLPSNALSVDGTLVDIVSRCFAVLQSLSKRKTSVVRHTYVTSYRNTSPPGHYVIYVPPQLICINHMRPLQSHLAPSLLPHLPPGPTDCSLYFVSTRTASTLVTSRFVSRCRLTRSLAISWTITDLSPMNVAVVFTTYIGLGLDWWILIDWLIDWLISLTRGMNLK